MNHPSIKRPKAPETKINTSDDFELAYLRHQYFRRVKYNPTEKEMQPYMFIVEHFTKNTYFTYQNLFRVVGLFRDDILNIGRVHLVSFLGLYALDQTPDKKEKFIEIFATNNFKDPVDKDFDNKNKATFTSFLKQRMEDLVRVCRQKSRNIKGKPSEEFLAFVGKNQPPKQHSKILKDHHGLGYRKIDFSIFKSIRKKADVSLDSTYFKFDDLWYVAIPLEQSPLSIEDLVGSNSNPFENDHNRGPEDLYEERELKGLFSQFNKKSEYRKKVTLRKFIAEHRNLCDYVEEVKTAKKMLKDLGVQI